VSSSTLALLVALGAGGCKPDLGAPPSLVTGPRILAIRGTPPEAKPDEVVTYDVLAVDVNGRVADPALAWALCLEPHPPAESNIVSSACLTIPDDATGTTLTAPIPSGENDACTLFGPISPPPRPGKPQSRPADADVTGGYYQPVRAVWQQADGSETAFTLERILCTLASAPTSVAGEYATNYVPNVNPVLASLTADPDGAAVSLFAAGQTTPPATLSVAPGQVVTLEAAWTMADQEDFLVYDVGLHVLVPQTESLRLAWFTTGGEMEFDATGRTDAEKDKPFTRNVWTAPTTPGPVHLWMVLRDSRGGTDFAEAEIDVTP
jgi:hypothetical protein